MNGRKRIIVIMILLFGLLMTTGVSTWIITSQVTFAPGYYDGPTVTYITPKFAGSSIDVSYNELTDGKSYSNLSAAVMTKATTVDAETNTSPLSFEDANGSIVTLTKDSDYTYSILFKDGTTTTSSSSTAAIGSTYQYTVTFTLTADASERYTLAKNQATTIVKYQTCQIGSDWYTIEDALATGNNVTLAGSDTSEQAQTSFTKIDDRNTVYPNENSYTVSKDKTLIVPYNSAGDDNGATNSQTGTDKIYSTLIIPKDITLTVNGTFTISANIASSVPNVSVAKERGVVLNNGHIEINSKVNCYGFIIGGGTINLNSGATFTDVMRIYDWRGGSASMPISEKTFPFYNYTMHNNSCFTTVYYGAKYNAFVKIVLPSVSMGVEKTVSVIGSDSDTAMFVLANGGCIEKTTTKPGTSIKQNNTTADNRDKLTVYGNCRDSSVTIEAKVLGQGVDITTGKNYPLPIGYMDVAVGSEDGEKTGNLSLENVSYNVLPTSTIKVNKKSTINITNGTKVLFADYNSYLALKGGLDSEVPQISLVGAGSDTPAKFEIYGTVNITGTSSLGGKVIAGEGNTAQLSIADTASTKTSFDIYNSTAQSLAATGSVYYTSQTLGMNVTEENKNLSNATTYTSIYTGESTYAWIEDKTITVKISCAGTIINEITKTDSVTGITVSSIDFTVPDTVKWLNQSNLYYDSACNALPYLLGGYTIHSDITLYVKYEYKETTYEIKFDANGGAIEPDSVVVDIKGINIDDYVPTLANHRFDGWIKEDEAVASGTILQSDFSEGTYILNLTATWTEYPKIVLTNNVTGKANGEVTISDTEGNELDDGSYVPFGTTINVHIAEKDGYKFTTAATYTINGNSGNTYQVQATDRVIEIVITGTIEESGGGTPCIVEGTLITLADGSRKRVEDLVDGDMLLTFNHITGELDAEKMWFKGYPGAERKYHDIITLEFSGNTIIKIKNEHGFYDIDENKYVFINYDNYQQYVGHRFYSTKFNGTSYITEILYLNNAYVAKEYTRVYGVATYNLMNCFAENLLNMAEFPFGHSDAFVNIFEYNEDMSYNQENMIADIEQYGLYEYELFAEYMSYETYMLLPIRYFKIQVEKGLIKFEDIIEIIEYVDHYGWLD